MHNTKIAVCNVVYYGSLVAGPYVGELFANIFNYKGYKPQYSEEDLKVLGKVIEMPNFTIYATAYCRTQPYWSYCNCLPKSNTRQIHIFNRILQQKLAQKQCMTI